jgi:hypothetical protein
MFAQKKVHLPPGRHKLIILDEADSMTPQSEARQQPPIYFYLERDWFLI